MAQINILFGATAKPLEEQISEQGLFYAGKDDIDHYQKDADAITRLSIRGILTAKEKHNARSRLIRLLSDKVGVL